MMKNSRTLIPFLYTVVCLKILRIDGHGRLIEPPSRASMWRYGFNTPPNYNDHELYCGGFTRQYQTNGGKCGICGDAWDSPQPRPHEAGGKYGQGIIVRKYRVGSVFTIRVELTANHRGHFEFRLCPNNAPKKVATQQCLDKYVLKRAKYTVKDPDEVYHETRFYPGTENKVYEMKYMLPTGLTCSQCVVQWKYIAGNNWGMCTNGTGAVGCGPQEEFRACSDISIYDGSSSGPGGEEESTTTTSVKTTTASTTTTTNTDDGKIKTTESTTIVETTTTAVDVSENEIPDDDDDDILHGLSKKSEQIRKQEYVLFMFSITLLSLGLVVIVFFLLYFYYYHASDRLQKWWSKRERWFGFKNYFSFACCWPADSKNNKIDNNNSSSSGRTTRISPIIASSLNDDEKYPVPPPRTKRHSIGFKGVPENLV